MPVNLSAQLRYITIDNCLRSSGRYWTRKALAKACGDALYENLGIDKIPSERTIYLDINTMKSGKLGYEAPIEIGGSIDNLLRDDPKEPKTIAYYVYSDPEFSIFNMPIGETDIQSLKSAMSIVSQFKGFSFLQDVGGVISKLERKVISISDTVPIIDFEQVPDAKGLEIIDVIYKSIQSRKVLEIHYHPFHRKEPFSVIIHPYYLKEYNNRWFLFGMNEYKGEKQISNFGLDRIVNLAAVEDVYCDNTIFDPETYFKHVLGVSIPKDKTVYNIILSFDPIRGQYVITKPIHWSQKILVNDDKEVRISLDLMINKELIREVLSFREDVKVLQPKQFVETMKDILVNISNKY